MHYRSAANVIHDLGPLKHRDRPQKISMTVESLPSAISHRITMFNYIKNMGSFSNNWSTRKLLLAWWFYISKHQNQYLCDSFFLPAYKSASEAPTLESLPHSSQSQGKGWGGCTIPNKSFLRCILYPTQKTFTHSSWARVQCWGPGAKSIWLWASTMGSDSGDTSWYDLWVVGQQASDSARCRHKFTVKVWELYTVTVSNMMKQFFKSLDCLPNSI